MLLNVRMYYAYVYMYCRCVSIIHTVRMYSLHGRFIYSLLYCMFRFKCLEM